MYTRFNLYHDMQVQGKYLLPVLLAFLVLFLVLFDHLLALLFYVLDRVIPSMNRRVYSLIAVGVAVTTAFAVHVHAVADVIIPFYQPPEFQLDIRKFKSVNLSNDNLIRSMRNMTLEVTAEGWRFESKAGHGFIVLHDGACHLFGPSTLMRITFKTDMERLIKVYYDEGLGHVQKHSLKGRFSPESPSVVFSLKKSHCANPRFDFMWSPGALTITDLAFAKVSKTPQ